MAEPNDKPTIANRALIELGLAPAYDAGNEEDFVSGQIDKVWPDVMARCLTLHDWSFCRRTKKLDRIDIAPENGWRFAFQMPGDRIGPPRKLLYDPRSSSAVLRRFDIEGDRVFADEPEIWGRFSVAVDPQVWDPAFSAAFVVALAAKLSVPLKSDSDMAAILNDQAFGTPSRGNGGGLFGRLMAQDRAGAPIGSPLTAADPLVNARY